LTHNPAKDVRTILNDDSALGLTTGTDLFLGPSRAVGAQVPADAVFVFGNSGIPPLRSMGEVAEIRRPLVNIRVRWSSFGPGDTKIRAIMNLLQAEPIATYLSKVLLTESEPLPLGQDAQGNHMWSLGCEVIYREAKA
jgi:hypothetical protein